MGCPLMILRHLDHGQPHAYKRGEVLYENQVAGVDASGGQFFVRSRMLCALFHALSTASLRARLFTLQLKDLGTQSPTRPQARLPQTK